MQCKLLEGKMVLKFINSEKATKFCEIFPLLLAVCTVVKSKGKISRNFVAFSEYMNFTDWPVICCPIVAVAHSVNRAVLQFIV